MLNDFFITRDVIGFLENFLSKEKIQLPAYAKKLSILSEAQFTSYEQWWELLNELDDLLKTPALGLEIGKYIKVGDCGILGYLFRSSRDMSEALSCFKRFQRLIYAGSQAHTELKNNEILSLIWNPEFGYSSQISDELLLSAMVNITREIMHPHNFNPTHVSFTDSIDKHNIQIYEKFFCCPILQKQTKLSISFKLSDLKKLIPHEDRTLHSILGKQAEELLKHLPDNDLFLVDLRDTIIRSLHEGIADTETISRKLNMSGRTLHRRLSKKNRVFRDILKDIRKSMALTYLSDNKLTLTEVALLLGYSDQSTFTRAFTLWYEMPPLQYKRQYFDSTP